MGKAVDKALRLAGGKVSRCGSNLLAVTLLVEASGVVMA